MSTLALHQLAGRTDPYAPTKEEAPPAQVREPDILSNLQKELERNRLDEIASLVRSLTYGEMIELTEAIWKIKPEGDLTEASLPGTLHRWATKEKNNG